MSTPKEHLGLFPPRASNEQGCAPLSQSASALLQACPGPGTLGAAKCSAPKCTPSSVNDLAMKQTLRAGTARRRKAKDLLRASSSPLLPPENFHVASDLAKTRSGERLSPVLLVRGVLGTGVPLVVADGYHRICASYRRSPSPPQRPATTKGRPIVGRPLAVRCAPLRARHRRRSHGWGPPRRRHCTLAQPGIGPVLKSSWYR